MTRLSLGLSARKTPAWWPANAVMAFDFRNDRYMKDGAPVARASVLSCASPSPRLAQDRSGHWHSFAPNVPAITNRGLFIQPAATNYAPNAGRPELMSSSAPAGISRQVLSTQLINGLPTVTMRFSGTALANGEIAINPVEYNAGPSAALGQTWHAGVFLAVIAGTLPDVSRLGLFERNASHTLLDASYVPLPASSALTRTSVQRALQSPSAARATSSLRLVVTTGQFYDFTIVVGPSDLSDERFADTVLTSGTSLHRVADAVTLLLPGAAHLLRTVPADGPATEQTTAGAWALPAGSPYWLEQAWCIAA
ncbi:hypothetical protein [Devosia elaeis]|uniref:Uncharacterized protein n=1 Tax=Devosia elaeis TaxID=1770058 RepID=A0A178I2S4_9HYPH|nr:hypothetical protein [Devosia elaeis]OAM78576.1 hypothetical protein A3840_05630 [Devosia elaeis]